MGSDRNHKPDSLCNVEPLPWRRVARVFGQILASAGKRCTVPIADFAVKIERVAAGTVRNRLPCRAAQTDAVIADALALPDVIMERAICERHLLFQLRDVGFFRILIGRVEIIPITVIVSVLPDAEQLKVAVVEEVGARPKTQASRSTPIFIK